MPQNAVSVNTASVIEAIRQIRGNYRHGEKWRSRYAGNVVAAFIAGRTMESLATSNNSVQQSGHRSGSGFDRRLMASYGSWLACSRTSHAHWLLAVAGLA